DGTHRLGTPTRRAQKPCRANCAHAISVSRATASPERDSGTPFQEGRSASMMMNDLDLIGRLGPACSRAIPHGVKKTVEHMRASPGPKMTMGELVRVCGVPERTQ